MSATAPGLEGLDTPEAETRTQPAAASAAGGGPAAFRLVRHFTLASLAAFAAVALAFVFFEDRQGEFFREVQEQEGAFFGATQERFARSQEEAAVRDLLAVHEAGNVNLTRVLSNALWERDFAPYVARAAAVSVEDCRAIAEPVDASGKPVAPPGRKACFAEAGRRLMALPGFAELDAKVVDSMRRSSVFKVKVFDLRGVTVYSSEHAQIGEDKAGNQGWRKAVAGTPASELTHRDRFSAFEGTVENRDLISSYLPVLAPGTQSVVAVFEIYSDVTPFLAQIRDTSAQIRAGARADRETVARVSVENQRQVAGSSRWQLFTLVALLAALFAALYLIVRRADRIIAAQERERERAHQQLSQAEKMASLGQMVAGVAHQLNTPLAFSRSNVGLAIERLDDVAAAVQVAAKVRDLVRASPGDRVVLDVARARAGLEQLSVEPGDVAVMKEMLGDVLKGIGQMSELVVHMRDFTRLDRARVAQFDVNEGLRSVVYLAASVIPGRVRVLEQYGRLPLLLCTPSQLNQVFLNLVVNAAQAIEGEGTVTVSSREEEGAVVVEVADTGAGVPEAVREQIFEPYFTTKPAGVGTGLGLPIARDIARAHGGDVTVRPRGGGGSIFAVRLPVGGLAAAA